MLGKVFVKRVFESDLPSAVWADINSLRSSLAQKDAGKAHLVCLKGLCSDLGFDPLFPGLNYYVHFLGSPSCSWSS